MKRVVVISLMTAACAPPAGYERVHDTFVGTYNLQVNDASAGFDRDVFDASVTLAVQRLAVVYNEPALERLVAALPVTVQDLYLPCDVKTGVCNGLTQHRGDVYGIWLSLAESEDCAAYTALAHELSHAARYAFEGDSDHDHHDTRFFVNDCRDRACRSAAVEHAKYEGRTELCAR